MREAARQRSKKKWMNYCMITQEKGLHLLSGANKDERALASQVESMKTFVAERDGWVLTGVYSDDGKRRRL
jgi:hypothetical protein